MIYNKFKEKDLQFIQGGGSTNYWYSRERIYNLFKKEDLQFIKGRGSIINSKERIYTN